MCTLFYQRGPIKVWPSVKSFYSTQKYAGENDLFRHTPCTLAWNFLNSIHILKFFNVLNLILAVILIKQILIQQIQISLRKVFILSQIIIKILKKFCLSHVCGHSRGFKTHVVTSLLPVTDYYRNSQYLAVRVLQRGTPIVTREFRIKSHIPGSMIFTFAGSKIQKGSIEFLAHLSRRPEPLSQFQPNMAQSILG